MEGEGSDDCRLHVATKQHWGDIYISSTPVPYYDTMTPFDYGHYHDRFLEIVTSTMDAHHPERDRQLSVVEVGSSYGNTTLAYKCNYNWEQTGQVWKDDSLPLQPVRDVRVTAVDMSGPALQYGLNRGVFDSILMHDFNRFPPTELVTSLDAADCLVMIMISSYIKTLPLQRLVYNFLGDRSKKKLFFFNDTCAFDTRNLSPEALFAGIKQWTAKSYFNKHRDFTEEERSSRHGCKESWTYTYVVVFDAIAVDNENVH